MIDLANPDISELTHKWGHLFHLIEPHNLFDTPTEIMWLCEAASRATSILECGAHRGLSTKAMATANPKAQIVVMDTWDDAGTKEFFEEILKDEIASGRVIQLHGLTDDGFARLALHHPNFRPDFVFIDASHMFPDVLHDIRNSLAIMNGGVISGHDYRHQIPNDGVNVSVREAFGDDFLLPIDSIWAKFL